LLSCLQSLLKQLSHIFLSRQVSLKEGQNGNFLLPTAYTAAKTVLCCQTHTLIWLRCSVDSVCVYSSRIASARNVTWGCAFRVLQQYHTKVRFIIIIIIIIIIIYFIHSCKSTIGHVKSLSV
jgi:hypothetical protein